MSVWNLPSKIIALSQADNWPSAVKEWEPDGVEILEGETATCLCGHRPIVELCFIRNIHNQNIAVVGNRCIEKFSKEDPAHAVFGDMPKIVASARRILEDRSSSANPEMIALALRKRIFSVRDASFYHDIRLKRKLTLNQLKYKNRLNRALLVGVIWSARQAFAHLRAKPIQGTAGPKLIKRAHESRVLKDRERDFYMQIWSRDHKSLTGKQADWKSKLNQKIIAQLGAEFA